MRVSKSRDAGGRGGGVPWARLAACAELAPPRELEELLLAFRFGVELARVSRLGLLGVELARVRRLGLGGARLGFGLATGGLLGLATWLGLSGTRLGCGLATEGLLGLAAGFGGAWLGLGLAT